MQPSGKRKKEHRDEMSQAKKRRELHYAMVVVGGIRENGRRAHRGNLFKTRKAVGVQAEPNNASLDCLLDPADFFSHYKKIVCVGGKN